METNINNTYKTSDNGKRDRQIARQRERGTEREKQR